MCPEVGVPQNLTLLAAVLRPGWHQGSLFVLLAKVDGCPVILLCGACDIGKSTFNRILINQLLNR